MPSGAMYYPGVQNYTQVPYGVSNHPYGQVTH